MTNIVEVYELEGTHVSKIYRFAGNNTGSTTSRDMKRDSLTLLFSASSSL